MARNNDKFDIYLQLEYLDDVLSAHPSDRLRRNIHELESQLTRQLRMLGVDDIERFKREVRDEIDAARRGMAHDAVVEEAPRGRHLADA